MSQCPPTTDPVEACSPPCPNGHRVELVAGALAAAITTFPRQVTRSLTWDQGYEMADHARFTVDTGIAVHFCDPQSPVAAGSNENTNGGAGRG